MGDQTTMLWATDGQTTVFPKIFPVFLLLPLIPRFTFPQFKVPCELFPSVIPFAPSRPLRRLRLPATVVQCHSDHGTFCAAGRAPP